VSSGNTSKPRPIVTYFDFGISALDNYGPRESSHDEAIIFNSNYPRDEFSRARNAHKLRHLAFRIERYEIIGQ
jgi:hypothetical protein